MQVFKAYFKIIRKRLPAILIYFVVFVGVSVIITSVIGKTGTSVFTGTKPNIAVFNEDAGAPIADGLTGFLKQNANLVDVPDDTQSIQDALFGGNITYVLRIPMGFTAGFMGGNKGVSLEKTAAAGSVSSVGVDFLIDRYLNIASLYIGNAPGMAASRIAENTARDIAVQSNVTVNSYGSSADTNYLTYYFQYLAYSIMAVMMMGVTSFMISFNEYDLVNRNQCSPMTPLRMNLQIVLGNAAFALVVWVVMCAAVFLLYGKAPQGPGVALLCANALAMTIVGLSMGFFAGKFIRNSGVQSAVTNVVSMGISFISGVFVEQQLLGQTVLSISRFLPGYWYVKAVNDIRGLASFDYASIQPVLLGILVQLGFAAVFFLVAFAASKQIKLNREI